MMHCQHSFWFLPIIRSLRANYDNYFQWFCYHWTLFCVFRDQFPIMNLLFCEIIYMPFYTYLHSCCSVAESCLTLWNPMDCSTPGFPVLHCAQTHIHCIDDAIQPSHPLSPPFPPSSIFPSIKVFSNELVLHIRWPKYCSFRCSISPSNEYSGIDFL